MQDIYFWFAHSIQETAAEAGDWGWVLTDVPPEGERAGSSALPLCLCGGRGLEQHWGSDPHNKRQDWGRAEENHLDRWRSAIKSPKYHGALWWGKDTSRWSRASQNSLVRCPELTPVSPLLAGHLLLAGCTSGMGLELCWRARVSDAGIQAVGPPPLFVIHWHFLRDSIYLTHKDKDLERELGVIYYVPSMDLFCLHWKLLKRTNKWSLKGIRCGDWASGCGIEMCPTPQWGEILNIPSWGSWRLVGNSSNTTADGQSSSFFSPQPFIFFKSKEKSYSSWPQLKWKCFLSFETPVLLNSFAGFLCSPGKQSSLSQWHIRSFQICQHFI